MPSARDNTAHGPRLGQSPAATSYKRALRAVVKEKGGMQAVGYRLCRLWAGSGGVAEVGVELGAVEFSERSEMLPAVPLCTFPLPASRRPAAILCM